MMSMSKRARLAVMFLFLAIPLRLVAAASPSEIVPPADLKDVRELFAANLQAIEKRDRAAYLACYLETDTLAITGPEGFRLGFAGFAKDAGGGWPDTFVGEDLQLVPVSADVVYGTYRYRVRYGNDEHSGISERVFRRTPAGWRIAVTTAFDAPAGTPPPPRALVGATLIDGTGTAPVADAVVVIRGGKIDCAGTRRQCPVPEGVAVDDVRGLWITPGLVDAHVHFSQTGWADGRPDALDVRKTHPYEQVEADLEAHPERIFRSDVCSGVTAVFDVGGYPWTLGLPGRADRDPVAPHVSAAGPLLSTIDHWLNLPAAKQFINVAEAPKDRVDYLASAGSSAIKVWYIVDKDHPVAMYEKPVAEAGEEAARKNLPLIVHATGIAEAKAALRAGAKMLVHSVEDAPVDSEFIDMAKKNGTIYCPTLTVLAGYLRLAEGAANRTVPPIDDPNGCVDAGTRAKVAETASVDPSLVVPGRLERLRTREERRNKYMGPNLMAVQNAGIPIAMGTDAGNPLTLHGPSVYAEMEAMQKAGMSPMEVLVASTRGGSLAMRREAEFGTVEKGKTADLLLVAADPSQDIASMRKVRFVIRGGARRSVEELAASIAAGK